MIMKTTQSQAGRAFAVLACALSMHVNHAQDGGSMAVIEASKLVQAPPAATPSLDASSIKNQLRKKLKEAKVTMDWDDAKQRFGGVATFTLQIDPGSDMEDYFVLRQTAALGAMLTAQTDVATWLGADASMEVTLKDPGNPALLEDVNAAAKRELEGQIAMLRKEAEAMGAKATADVELTSADRFKAATDALIKRLDVEYDPARAADEKEGKIAGFRRKAEDVNAAIARLQARLEAYQRAYAKAVNAGIGIRYDHVILGLSAIAWGENLAPSGRLTIGIAYVWSPRLARSAQGALTGDTGLDIENAKGAESLSSWIERQDLASMGAFRYFVDDKGDRWFIGTGYAPNSLDQAGQHARLQALANLYMPLYSRLQGEQRHRSVVRAGRREADLPAKAAMDLSESLNSFARANTRGVNQVAVADLTWPAKITKSGEGSSTSVAVAVYALNARSASAALAADAQMAVSAAAVEHETNRRRLEHAHLLGSIERAKGQHPPARVTSSVEKASAPEQGDAARNSKATPRVESGQQVSPRPGSKVTPGKAQDDF